MTKTSKNFMLFIAVFFFLFVPFASVNAACDYARQVELATYAANVNVTYEAKTIVLDENDDEIVGMTPDEIPEEEHGNQDSIYGIARVVDLEIRNITEDIYVGVVETNLNNESFTVYYEDTEDGTYIYRIPDTDSIHNYVITVYSGDSNCFNQQLTQTTLVTPKYNSFHDSSACIYLTDKYYCQEFITTDLNMSYEDLASDMSDYFQEGEEIPDDTENQDFWNKYGTFIMIGVGSAVLIIGLIIVVMLIVRKRRKVL